MGNFLILIYFIFFNLNFTFKVFPLVLITYCLFHLAQMLVKRMKKIPEVAQLLIDNDSEGWRMFRKLKSLAFFPLNEVRKAFARLKRED